MAVSTAATMAKHLLFSPSSSLRFSSFARSRSSSRSSVIVNDSSRIISTNTSIDKTKKEKEKEKEKKKQRAKQLLLRAAESAVKKRTRSDKEFDEETIQRFGGDNALHIPVMLGEVLDVFSSYALHTFVDCTVGAAGHSSAIIQAHPELQLYVGMDVDTVAHEKARAQINALLHGDSCCPNSDLKAHTLLKNFRYIKSAFGQVDEQLLDSGVDGILMDLGMSSMQVNNPDRGFSVLGNGPLDMRMDPMASLRAEDILNSWPESEVGRILQEYGEESNWWSLQKRIVRARSDGGLHSTGELVDLIRNATPGMRGGRQGWIKTATRVFQALRIAVNDELKTLEDALYDCFDCLAPGGRLAVISFHSLEDRIVKQTFLDIISGNNRDEGGCGVTGQEDRYNEHLRITINNSDVKETWIKQIIQGSNGTILTKRPITPSEEEENLNRRSRSAKLRVIQKV